MNTGPPKFEKPAPLTEGGHGHDFDTPSKDGHKVCQPIAGDDAHIEIPQAHMRGWFRAYRSDEALELLRANVKDFALLYLIAYRAQWKSGFNRHNLQPGEAFIGGDEHYGLTEREYRTAKAHLKKWGFATFKPTNKGTIATLINPTVFSILNDSNDKQTDRQPTGNRQAADRRPTTTNNYKNEKEGEGNPPLSKVERISAERELREINKELGKRGVLKDYTAGSPTHKRIVELTEKQKVLRAVLGVVA